MKNCQAKSDFLLSVADLVGEDVRWGEYQDVILPHAVLRQMHCVLEPTQNKVVARYHQYMSELEKLDPPLQKLQGYALYSTSHKAQGSNVRR